jgi:hypothetical protein
MIKSVVREVLQEFMELQRAKAEPAYKAELTEERKRREQLEGRLNDLVQENQRARQRAEEVERNSTIRTELQRLGVAKVDIAFRAVKDDIVRLDDGQLKARTAEGEQSLREYLTQFVTENPELLPARIVGGSGATPSPRSGGSGSSAVDLDKIRPGMSAEDMERVRQEIVKVAAQQSRGI